MRLMASRMPSLPARAGMLLKLLTWAPARYGLDHPQHTCSIYMVVIFRPYKHSKLSNAYKAKTYSSLYAEHLR